MAALQTSILATCPVGRATLRRGLGVAAVAAAIACQLFAAGEASAQRNRGSRGPRATDILDAPAGANQAQPTTTQPAEQPAATPAEAAQPAGTAPQPGVAAEAPAPQRGNSMLTPAITAEVAKNASGEKQFMFNASGQRWRTVLEQFAREAGLSLTMDTEPQGSFNFSDTRRYNVTEALDVLNRILYTTKGYLLVKHDNILLLVDTDANEVAPSLIPDVPLDELDKHGEYELVRVLYPVWNMTAEQAGEQVRQLLGPKMKVVTLPQSRQIQVTEIVERHKTIRRIIEAGNQPGPGGFRAFPLRYISADAAMPVLRQSLGIVKGADVTPDGNATTPASVRLTRSAVGNVLLFQGSPEGSARLEQLLKLIDVPESGLDMARETRIISLGGVDPKKAVEVLEEQFRGNPNISFVEDAASGTLTAVAPPPAQTQIAGIIEMMQKDAKTVEIIPLSRLDPVSAKSIVTTVFGSAGTPEAPNPNGVAVDYDAQQRVLIVRGTRSQISQVKEVLTRLGESADSNAGALASRDRIRVLPYSQAAGMTAIRQIERLVPELGDRIRIVSPPKGIPVRRPFGGLDAMEGTPPAPQQQQTLPPRGANRGATVSPRGSEQTPAIFERTRDAGQAVPKTATVPMDRETQAAPKAAVRFVSQSAPADEPAPGTAAEAAQAQTTTQPGGEPKKPVIVVPGPTGLIVVSEDMAALDDLERLLTLVAPAATSTDPEFAVFYLQYATAENAAGVLGSIYGTGNNRGGGGGGRGGRGGGGGGGNIAELITGQITQQLAGSAGDALTGLLGGAGFSSAAVVIVPIVDKNAVLVRAKPSDLDMIGQVIEIVDQKAGPIDDESDPEPRRIQVRNVLASEMASIIQTLYADKMAAGGGGGQQDILRQLTGGGGAQQQEQKMTMYADNRSNQLIVRAPAALFEKVASMVDELDQVSFQTEEISKVIPLSQASMASIKAALDPIAAATQQANNNQQNANNNQNNQLNQQLQLQQIQQLLGRGGGGGNQGGARGGARGGGNAGGGAALQGILGGGRGGGGAAAGGGRGGGGGGGAAAGGGGRGGGGGGGRGGRGG